MVALRTGCAKEDAARDAAIVDVGFLSNRNVASLSRRSNGPGRKITQWDSGSIFTSNGATHRRLRRTMEPIFTPKAIRSYTSILDSIVKDTLPTWTKNDFLSLESVSLIATRVFFSTMLETIGPLFQDWMHGFTSPVPIAYPGSVLSKALNAKKQLVNYFTNYLKEYQKEHPSESESTLLPN